MGDYRTIEVGDTLARAFSLVKRADGAPIVGGTVNYYLLALTGANAGKWWKDSDQTWDAAETANAMTHQADGHWTRALAASPWGDGVAYLEYAKESGNLHVPVSRNLKGAYTALGDASGRVKLQPAGLDDITTTAPAGVAANFREMLVQVWRRFFKKTVMATAGGVTTLKTYADDGATVITTETVSESATAQTKGPAT